MSNSNSSSTSESSKHFFFSNNQSMEQFTKEGFKACMDAIRISNALPSERDWDFYKTSDVFNRIMSDESTDILRVMNKIMKCNAIESSIKSRNLDEKTELVIEANDIILEKAANNIDEMNGIRKSAVNPVVIQTVSAEVPIVNGSWNRTNNITFSVNSLMTQRGQTSTDCIRLITAKNIIRPQKFFKDKVDNSNRFPWQPRIKDKPNSLKPLAIFLEEFEDRQEFSHPYECELERFEPLAEQLTESPCISPKPLDETPLIEINQPEQLNELIESLRNCKEFAIDLEHHSYRSFMGITCLMQISTHESDYLIDTLALREHLHVLNEVFTKKSIVKIFHGANHDIEWLQRDLSLYVVNMFDTHQAAKILEYSGLSLAYLLKRYCNVLANKQFQLADWRMRPLPDELKMYARVDTHYLIFIYQMMKNELLAKANNSDKLVRIVLERSNEICQKRYFKPILSDESHLDIYRKCNKMFDNRQLYALKEIYAWRDRVAREEDESLAYVLPNHMLLQIAETLPREMQGIMACCNPIPPLVRSNLLELHQIMLKARDQPIEKAILKDDTSGRGILKAMSKLNVDSPLHCPHDLSKSHEFRDDLPNLLAQKCQMLKMLDASIQIEKKTPKYLLFGCSDGFGCAGKKKCLKTIAYLSPYERYKLVKPFVQAEEDKLAQEKKEQLQETNDSRTDEDRIASIRDHYFEMSKKFSDLEKQKREEQKSLIELGGTRKRKRELSENSNEDDPDLNTLHTPAPVIKFDKNKGGKNRYCDYNVKQKSEEFKKNKKNKKRQAKKQANVDNALNNNQKNKTKKNNNNNKAKFEIKQDVGESSSSNYQNHENNQQMRQGKRKQQQDGNNLPKKTQHNQGPSPNKKQRKNNQKNEEFVPYDYSSVDFRQFQGGGGSANTGAPVKTGFRGKNKRRPGNRGNRSSTFHNEGRGRGRGR